MGRDKRDPRRTAGLKYPSAHWLRPASTSTVIAEVPRSFQAAMRREWVGYVEDETMRFQAHDTVPTWTDRGASKPIAATAGAAGPWYGPAHMVESLIPEELAAWWTLHAVRLNLTDYTIARWDEELEMRDGMLNAAIATAARSIMSGDDVEDIAPIGTIATHAGFVWERVAEGWSAIVDDVDGVPTPRDPATVVGAFAFDAFTAALEGAGVVTATMLGMIRDAYRDGVTGRRGRVIAAAGDLDAAIARACGTVPLESKRGQAIAAARAAAVEPVSDVHSFIIF